MSKMEKSIVYICPECAKEMIAYRLKGEWLDKWYCENCGYDGLYALAEIKEKPDCVHWKEGYCDKVKFLRNDPKCMYYKHSQNMCSKREYSNGEEDDIVKRLSVSDDRNR